MSLVEFDVGQGAIGVIRLNNPDALNAMDEDMAKEFKGLIRQLKSQDISKSHRVLVLTGNGRAFSAGGNLEMLRKKQALSAVENKKLMLEFYNSFLSVLDLGLPIIAAINGHAIGAGLCVACACDIRVVAKDAKLGFTFSKIGLHPGMGATFFVPRILGRGLATELLITGRVISGESAFSLGLCSRVVEASDVMPSALQVAKEIVSCAPEASTQLLETLRGDLSGLGASLEREADCQAVNYAGENFKEGLAAQMEKRAPNW